MNDAQKNPPMLSGVQGVPVRCPLPAHAPILYEDDYRLHSGKLLILCDARYLRCRIATMDYWEHEYNINLINRQLAQPSPGAAIPD